MSGERLLSKGYLFVAPFALVLLAVVGLVEISQYPTVGLNSFDQLGTVSFIAGGFAGLYLLAWDLMLRRASSNLRRWENLTASAAVFGILFGVFFVALTTSLIVTSFEPNSKLVPFVLVATSGQLMTFLSWLTPKVLSGSRVLSQRFCDGEESGRKK